MITFKNFGKKGRLGNQLFQYAAMIGFAEKYNETLVMPPWVYSEYFKYFPSDYPEKFVPVKEPAFHFTPEFYDIFKYKERNHDFDGYFQSEKYWIHAVDKVMLSLKFDESFSDHVAKKFSKFFSKDKKTIAISIRRGDYVNNQNYAQIPITFYLSALEKFFPNWKTENNVIIFSDDIPYCKIHFGCFENVFFTENSSGANDRINYFKANTTAIEQLCLMSMCQHFIISNSTFSWWGAYLGETSESKIIRHEEHFSGKLLKNNNTKDHYPDRWLTHKEERIEMNDVTFMIPVTYDHPDRLQNLQLNVCLLQRYLNAKIIIGENQTNRFKNFTEYGCEYIKFSYPDFHRTKMLNEMAKVSQTSIVVNWDADVFVSPIQLFHSVDMIRTGRADMVFPYDGRFARVKRIPFFKQLEQSLDVGCFSTQFFPGTFKEDRASVGGAILFNKEKFFEGGGENENFVSYGPEDVERDLRFRRLGYKVERTPGVIYHLDHWKGHDSKSNGNKFHKQNHDEMAFVDSLKNEGELRDYVNSWKHKKEFE